MAEPWSADHLRLHRRLRQRPELLPPGATLLLAISGGQDSMALLALLRDLSRLYHWSLQLWHGDHGWRAESAAQAAALAAWAQAQGLPLWLERWPEPQAGEAAARQWRYGRLGEQARILGASRVVTGHTSSDRAETLLLQLARGSHRRGSGPRALRPLAAGVELARPLLVFSRADTGRLCRELNQPVWQDSSNADPHFSRNRIRAEVLPVLEALHPGASARLSALGERWEQEEPAEAELEQLALGGLLISRGAVSRQAEQRTQGLDRPGLMALAAANRRRLLQRWLRLQGQEPLPARQLEALLQRLEPARGPGRHGLAGGCTLHWDRCSLWLAVAEERA
jgi:tRNA(Ile)-lysidine synthase